MNTFNSNSDIESLISSLKQLQAEQSICKENTLLLQNSLDELKRDFCDREERKQVQNMQEIILQLSTQVAELQQCLSQMSVGNNGFIYPVNNEVVNREQDLDDDEMVSHLLDLMEEEPFDEVTEEIEEKREIITEADKEFKVERMMFLLDKIYSVEE
ncbi:MAG: hypothetical protein AAF915_26300 [Cyanobacteria bacterium P01_D01_bin.50]